MDCSLIAGRIVTRSGPRHNQKRPILPHPEDRLYNSRRQRNDRLADRLPAMRVALLTTNLQPNNGWPSVAVKRGTALMKLGIEVVALTQRDSAPPDGIAPTIEDGVSGFLVEQNNPEALAARIVETLKDRARHSQLSAGAREFARAHTCVSH